MNRGRRGEQVFVSKDDYECLIAVLQEAIALFALRVNAYCLMTTHYHLLVQTPDANLSRCLRHINGVYTQRFKRFKAGPHSDRGLAQRVEQVRQIVMRQGQT
jgi:putative transposase